MTADSAAAWSAYWAGVDDRHIFAVEARDHVARLRAAVPVRPTDRVLDFGCGFGHAVELLAPTVAAVGYWDAAEGMRRATSERVRRFATAFSFDPVRPGPADRFDLVLVNSVVQYMAREEFRGWIPRWRSVLAPGGRIVLSDVPDPATSAVGEVIGMLGFAVRHRFLVRALGDAAREAHRYARSRGGARLTRWAPGEVVGLARTHGLSATVLPANLTHRTRRFSVVLGHARPAGR